MIRTKFIRAKQRWSGEREEGTEKGRINTSRGRKKKREVRSAK
jgi:hypothetical protein